MVRELETLTIQLPPTAAHRLRRVADLAQRSVDEIVTETLDATLPPLLEDVPSAFRADLAALEPLSSDALREEMQRTLHADQVAEYDTLLERNAAGALDAAGQQALSALRHEADLLMFRKAYAALLLKWRGQRVPTLAEMEA